MKINHVLLAAISAAMLAGCGGENASEQTPGASPSEEAVETASNEELLEAVLAGEHRTQEERARDVYRHPKETLLFYGVEPGMSVVEAWPGGGWYTQVIAPYLKEGGGKLYTASFSEEGASERVLENLASFRRTYVEHPEIYGEVEMSALGDGYDAAPEGTADVALTFRNIHNWMGRGAAEEHLKALYRALKPGGVLGIVEHRADGSDLPHDGSSGYVYEEDVIALTTAAGFDFESRSDINANPSDTKDHPYGVWTLPPVRRSSEVRGMEDPDFDRAKYDAIGESDRMTLKFRKPVAADGALLE